MKKKPVIISIVALLALAAAAIFFVQASEQRVTDDFVSRADRFDIPTDWALEDEVVRPERFLCIGTNPCPSIYRRWSAPQTVTPADLNAVASRVGFVTEIEGTCQRRSNDIGRATVCTLSGADGEYSYHMAVTDQGGSEPDLVVLTGRPHLQILSTAVLSKTFQLNQ